MMMIQVCGFNLEPDSRAFLQHAQLAGKRESQSILKREKREPTAKPLLLSDEAFATCK